MTKKTPHTPQRVTGTVTTTRTNPSATPLKNARAAATRHDQAERGKASASLRAAFNRGLAPSRGNDGYER